ncbi:MAG: hypothetical protein EXQ96_11040 [Alphaproteobacteria bacterium]|nr:hypothetical protein [Alphaproteobacteria bacterium]
MLEGMGQQHPIDAVVGQRQLRLVGEQRQPRPLRRPAHDPLARRHHGEDPLRGLAVLAQVGDGIAEAEHALPARVGPHLGEAAADHAPRQKPDPRAVELRQLHYVQPHAANLAQPPVPGYGAARLVAPLPIARPAVPTLLISPASPFVRKVRVFAAEAGVADRITIGLANSWDPADPITRHHPAAKVPTLLLDDGGVIYDSNVICEYLDSLHGGRKLIPAALGPRLLCLRQTALASACMEAGVLVRQEGRRPEGERSPWWVTRQTEKVARCFDAMDRELGEGALKRDLDLAHISFACAVGYIDFRSVFERDWREGRPHLAAFYADFAKRPSMVATVPEVAPWDKKK